MASKSVEDPMATKSMQAKKKGSRTTRKTAKAQVANSEFGQIVQSDNIDSPDNPEESTVTSAQTDCNEESAEANRDNHKSLNASATSSDVESDGDEGELTAVQQMNQAETIVAASIAETEVPSVVNKLVVSKHPTQIHLIDGEKGGAGKTFVSRAFIEYCMDKQINIALVDADPSNKDISKIYPGCVEAFFSDDEKLAREADKIFDLAFEKSVLVNLPAQVYENVTNWIDRNDLIELGKENSIQFVKWFVCTGGYDSVKFFLKSVEHFGERITHVFVKNIGLCDDWSYVESMEEYQNALSKYNFIVMNFPKFSYWERNMVDRYQITFTAAIDSPEFGVVSKQRVKNFLKDAYKAFDDTGLVR